MHSLSWGWPIVAEQFLFGLAAGAFLVAAALDLFGKKKEFAPISKEALLAISAPLPVLGMIILVAELGRPERASNAMLNLMVLGGSSVMSRTVPIVGAFTGLAVLTGLLWLKPEATAKVRRYIQAVGIILAIPAALQAGLLLQAAGQRNFWTTPIFPYLYLITAILAGIGIVGMLMIRRGFDTYRDTLVMLVTVALLLIVIQAAVLVVHIAVASTIAPFEVKSMLSGAYPLFAPLFYVGVLLIGMIIPAFYAFRSMKTGSVTPTDARTVFALLILGALLLRINMLWVGQAI